MKKFSIDPISISDLPHIRMIENESYPQPWNFSHFNNELLNNYSLNLKISFENTIAGYTFSSIILNELQINNFCISSKYQNQGVGTQLLNNLLVHAREKGATNAFLEVRKNNVAAIKLYSKFNFKVSYIRKKFYSNGDDALVMYLTLSET